MKNPLTHAQTRLITLVAQGYSNKQLADVLHRSIKTVETHRRACIERMGAANSAHAVALALSRGIIDPAVITTKKP